VDFIGLRFIDPFCHEPLSLEVMEEESMTSLNVSLPEPMKKFIESEVKARRKK
jgi:hypothetical protein